MSDCQCNGPGFCQRYNADVTERAYELCSRKCPPQRPCPSESRIKVYLASLTRILTRTPNNPVPTAEEVAEYPGIVEMVKRFRAEWRAWRAAGKPVVSAETKARRRAICLACPQYDPAQDRCRACGCYLHRIKVGGVIDADALSWATKQCPLDPPKWRAEAKQEDKAND